MICPPDGGARRVGTKGAANRNARKKKRKKKKKKKKEKKKKKKKKKESKKEKERNPRCSPSSRPWPLAAALELLLLVLAAAVVVEAAAVRAPVVHCPPARAGHLALETIRSLTRCLRSTTTPPSTRRGPFWCVRTPAIREDGRIVEICAVVQLLTRARVRAL